jgi:hypothetical protein
MPASMLHKPHVGITPRLHFECVVSLEYGKHQKKEGLKQVRIYQKEHGILRRLAFRKNTTVAEIIRQLIKGV